MAIGGQTPQIAWWKEPTKDQWYAWWAAWLGWTLDAFDFTVFLLIMKPIADEFGVPVSEVAWILALTLWMLRSPARDPMGRALEAAAVVAVTPIVTSYSWGTHLVLLLLPMLVLIVWSVRRRDWTMLGLVALGDLLIGPGHHWLQTLLVSGYSNLLVLRLAAEFGVAGVMVIWVATLLAVRRGRLPQRLDVVRATSART